MTEWEIMAQDPCPLIRQVANDNLELYRNSMLLSELLED